MMKCAVCGVNALGEYCFRHKRRKPIPVKRPMPKAVNTERIQIRQKETGRMRAFFLSLWMRKRHVSEISDTYLGREPLSIYFHHILPKEKYPEAMYDDENIILLTLDEHSNVEINMYRYEVINTKRNYLLEKYNLI